MEQKPVACLSKHDLYVTDYGSELCESLTDSIYLFAADQLKAEREMAIRECSELFTFNHKQRVLALLSTNESKENEVKG